ncbi:MAG: fumarylacetoacetate hydrolase family protein [Betaproteobacteria bacterium]|nr:MAG: fumarylacetoacetate hydrolase family protein [Betaproteobacteria bacterium]
MASGQPSGENNTEKLDTKKFEERIETAAQLLLEQHAQHLQFSALPDSCAPRDDAEAYAVQEALRRLRAPELGKTAGYKVALTSTVMQEMLRYFSPFAGPLHAHLVHHSGVQLDHTQYGRLCIECELAAVLGSTLLSHNAPYSREQIADAVVTIAPALELVDDRNADYGVISKLVLTLIADNAWNAGVVLGSALKDWRHLDLANLHGTVMVNGETTGEGYGRDVLGHPLEALRWLVNTIAAQGKDIEAGMVVMTGTMIATQFVKPGDNLKFSVDELGSVEVSVH